MSEELQAKQYKVHGIELMTFSIQPPSGQDFSLNTYEFTINQEQKTNPAKKLVIVFTTITIQETDNKSFAAKLEVACGFEILQFEKLISPGEAGSFIIPHDLNAAINRISISVCRGILYSQLRGSYLQSLILPLLPNE